MNRKLPIYVIQGNIETTRRDYSLLLPILKKKWNNPFQVKIIGKGKSLPDILTPFQDKILLKQNLNFQDYHREFLDCYCLFTLTSKKTTPHYYTNSLTSSVHYSRAYQLYTILDKPLQAIYRLQNTFTHEEDGDLLGAFKKSLDYFFNHFHQK